MKLLFIGDVVGSPGRKGLAAVMPRLRQQHSPDLVVVNGENSAGGLGITEKTAGDIFNCGADVITGITATGSGRAGITWTAPTTWCGRPTTAGPTPDEVTV